MSGELGEEQFVGATRGIGAALAGWPDFAVTLVTSEHRGDHAADVRIAVAANGRETVGELLHRLAPGPTDVIELRTVTSNGLRS